MNDLLEKRKVVSYSVTLGSFIEIQNEIINFAKSFQSSYISVSNVHMNVEAHWDKTFAQIIENSDITTADGMPIAKAIKFLYGTAQERVSGMDLLPKLLEQAEHLKLNVFFYGGTQEMLDKTKDFVQDSFPGITHHHYFSPPFRPQTALEESEIINKINESNANLVFVALGCPKQEKWMASMKGRINACMIGIGGALPVMIGMQKRAPKWMQRMSLEWLHRLFQEPKRLFKRYLITNSIFIYLLLVQIIRIRIFKKEN